MIELYLLLIQEDVNQRNLEDQELELEFKNLIDDQHYLIQSKSLKIIILTICLISLIYYILLNKLNVFGFRNMCFYNQIN
jgi:hypothetical protein